MERVRWIVVGTDFSEAADRALERAVDLAAKWKVRLACVHAFEDPPLVHGATDDPTPALHSELADAVARSGARARGVQVELILRRGAPWDKLVNVAADLGADLIVVGAQGRRGAAVFLGSVTTRLAASSTRCVLVVPAHAEPTPGGNGAEEGLP
jgi:nucleotide-binding universal stress UspA family protein